MEPQSNKESSVFRKKIGKIFVAKLISSILLIFGVFVFSGCVSLGNGGSEIQNGIQDDKTQEENQEPIQIEKIPISRNLADQGIKSAEQLQSFFMDSNPDADSKQILQMAETYIQESTMEGINSDCAFVQMCLETGFLKFGGLVTPDMHNYCGLGAIDSEHTGEVFETQELGIRAHIQHLHAYATTEDVVLKNDCIDRRYKWVRPRGKATDVFGLTKTWAADPDYGTKLDSLLTRLEDY